MKPIPWLAVVIVGIFFVSSSILAYCFWRGIGPNRWYARGLQPINEAMMRALFPTSLANAMVFAFLFIFAILGIVNRECHPSHGVHAVLRVVAILDFILMFASALLSFVIFVSGRPKRMIPPPFRDMEPKE